MKIIKDRHARTENRKSVDVETRVTLEEVMGVEDDSKGMTMEQFRGNLKDPGRSATKGVPTNMPGAADDAPQDITAPRCNETTLKGEACQAYPVTGTTTCVGHARQIEFN